MPDLDPLTEFDWAGHWRRLVEAREAQVAAAPRTDFWDRRARNYDYSIRAQADAFTPVIEPFLAPHKTALDVGAGTGRHVAAIAPKVDWVTAVEPSQAMRERIPPRENLTIVATTWEDADVAGADLVYSCHVLYPIADAVAFIQKMNATARERVFLYLRDDRQRIPSELLWEIMSGHPRGRQPQFYDAYNLLRWMGIHPEVSTVRVDAEQRFEDLEQALDDCRLRVGEAWDEDRGRQWLQENLKNDEDGGLVFKAGEMTSGVAHWRPRP